MEKEISAPLEALLQMYRGRKHPLDYHNRYQLVVMVVLSARDSDKHINSLAPQIFAAYPTMSDLAAASPEALYSLIAEVSGAGNKAQWLVKLAQMVGSNEAIPRTLDELIKLPGIGRKSANVIIRESGGTAEGIIVDLHVVRVAPRIGLASGDKPEKIEKQLMEVFPPHRWAEAGMALSFLGREICRPTNPKCPLCPVRGICMYYRNQ